MSEKFPFQSLPTAFLSREAGPSEAITVCKPLIQARQICKFIQEAGNNHEAAGNHGNRKKRGIKTANMKKVEIIRAIQLNESNAGCYNTGDADKCGQTECLWKADCV